VRDLGLMFFELLWEEIWRRGRKTSMELINSMGKRFGSSVRRRGGERPQQDGVVYLSVTVVVMTTSLLITMSTSPGYYSVQAQQLQLHPVDLGVLQAVKESMWDLPGGTFFSSWQFNFSNSTTDDNPCVSFSGVQCVNVDGFNRVSSLWLGPQTAGSPGLSGSLSPLLGSLNFLSELTISSGSVRGTIPESLGNLLSLQMFSCSENRLSGSIPSSFVNLKSLQILQLGMNSLDGSVPWELGQLPSLKVLVLSDNKLSGPIPLFSANVPLVHLELRNNFFSGGLPMTLPSSLQYLSLKKNCLTGWLGSGGLMSSSLSSSLSYLDLSYNQFTGVIPSVLFTFPLTFLLLNHNQFTEGLSLTAPINTGSVVDLSYNHLQGPIPSFLSTAQSLFLNNNFFVGAISQVSESGVQFWVPPILFSLELLRAWFDCLRHPSINDS